MYKINFIFLFLLIAFLIYIVSYDNDNYLTLNFQYPFFTNNNHIYLFGTNAFGEDIFYLTLYNILYFIFTALVISIFSLMLAFLLGIISGYYGGWFDIVIQRFYEVFISIPFLYLILLINNIITLNFFSFCILFILFNFMPLFPYIRYLSYTTSNSLYISNLKNIGMNSYLIIVKYLTTAIIKKLFFMLILTVITTFLTIIGLNFFNITPYYNNSFISSSVGGIIIQGLTYKNYSYMAFLPVLMVTLTIILLFFISQYYFLKNYGKK
jgi:microcin C transport system permease protein